MYKYFLEIKNRLTLVLICWFLSAAVSYYYKKFIIFLFSKSIISVFKHHSFYFITTNVTDIFTVALKISYFTATQITVLYGMYHIIIFLSPALYKNEFKIVKSILFYIFLIWSLNLVILNNIVLPYTWKFFMNFQTSMDQQNINIYFETKLNEYIDLYLVIYYISTLICQLNLFLYLYIIKLARKTVFIRTYRKYLYALFYFFATIITPPDVVSQLVLGTLLSILFELIIIIIIMKSI